MTDLIKCLKCGHVLVAGSGCIFLGVGITIECRKCGNSHVIGDKEVKKIKGVNHPFFLSLYCRISLHSLTSF